MTRAREEKSEAQVKVTQRDKGIWVSPKNASGLPNFWTLLGSTAPSVMGVVPGTRQAP
jgi:hypothetical protein